MNEVISSNDYYKTDSIHLQKQIHKRNRQNVVSFFILYFKTPRNSRGSIDVSKGFGLLVLCAVGCVADLDLGAEVFRDGTRVVFDPHLLQPGHPLQFVLVQDGAPAFGVQVLMAMEVVPVGVECGH